MSQRDEDRFTTPDGETTGQERGDDMREVTDLEDLRQFVEQHIEEITPAKMSIDIWGKINEHQVAVDGNSHTLLTLHDSHGLRTLECMECKQILGEVDEGE